MPNYLNTLIREAENERLIRTLEEKPKVHRRKFIDKKYAVRHVGWKLGEVYTTKKRANNAVLLHNAISGKGGRYPDHIMYKAKLLRKEFGVFIDVDMEYAPDMCGNHRLVFRKGETEHSIAHTNAFAEMVIGSLIST